MLSGPRVLETGISGGLQPSDVARDYHNFLVKLISGHPGKFVGLGLAHPTEPSDEMFREMERAIKELGLRGFMVVPRYGKDWLDSPKASPFFELCEELGAVVFVHSADGCIASEHMHEHRLIELVGRPNEMTLLAARLIFAGHMERYPKLKLLLARLGGAITMYAGRIEQGWQTRHSRSSGIPPWGPDNIEQSFMNSLRRIHFDTQSFHPPAIRCAVDTVGADRVLLGSDFPPVPHPLEESIEDVRASGVSAKNVEKILGTNAKRVFAIS